MKIVFIITDYGSFNNFLGELSKKMTEAGHEVHVICDVQKTINYKDKFDYRSLGIHFYFLPFKRNFSPFSWLKTSKKIKKIIGRIKPDIVNTHFTTSMFIAFSAGRINYPTVGVFHGVGFPVIKSRLRKFAFRQAELFCFRKLDKILLINEMDYRIVKKLFPQKALKYKSFGVGCDLQSFDTKRFSPQERDALRKEMNIEAEDFVLMFTGRFTFFKGFGLVIKAFRYIEQQGLIKDIKLLLVGGKDMCHSTGLNAEEEKYVEINPNIVNVGFTSDVARYLSVAELFVFPSSKEGMPVSIMEAIAMGVAVLGFDSRGTNDIVKNNVNGILLPVTSDYKEIAAAIVRLHSNRSELKRFASNAIKERDLLDRTRFIDESIQILENCGGMHAPKIKRFYLSGGETVMNSPESAGK